MHPIALQVGSLTITWYGVMVATAFLVGLWNASRRAPTSGIIPEKVLDLGPWLIVGTVIGARALYVISYWHEQFAGQPLVEIFKVWRGGLVYYGGLIGATSAGILYAKSKRLPLWRLGDVVAPSIALGSVFGRIGCLLNGCCYGRECDLPWAIHFPYGHQTYPHGVHPTEVYDSLLNFILYLFLAWLYRRKKFDGEIFASYLIGYAVFRSFVEMYRGDYPQHYLGGWATPAQLVSMGIFVAGVILWLLLARFKPQAAPSGS
ncbi:MAG TPA: prolipoprotein diacylglyceryl transferase [Verrucomicrobiae bacterium]|nr:prolipoprotein diacylglyceryl transferase [Verrucomicrobiae bacterium]